MRFLDTFSHWNDSDLSPISFLQFLESGRSEVCEFYGSLILFVDQAWEQTLGRAFQIRGDYKASRYVCESFASYLTGTDRVWRAASC